VRHFAYNFQGADDAVQMDLHKTLYHFYTTKMMTHVTVTITKNALWWQQYPGPRYITIIYIVGYLQIFKAENFLSSKQCHNFKGNKHWRDLQLNHTLLLYFT